MNKITELIGKEYSIMTYALSTSTSAATNQLDSLIEERDAILDIMSVNILSPMNSYLTNKATSLGGTLVTFGSYGVGNIGEWVIYIRNKIFINSLSYNNSNSFMCIGQDMTYTFTTNKQLLCNLGGTYVRCNVVSSTYTTDTIVTVSGGELTSDLSEIYDVSATYTPGYTFLDNNSVVKDNVTFVDEETFTTSSLHNLPVGLEIETNLGITTIMTYEGDGKYTVFPNILTSSLNTVGVPEGISWNNDATIIKYISNYDFAYDHLYHPLGSTGTYGILGKISALSSGMDIMNFNKNKQDQINSIYREYTTWSPLPETPIYENEMTFYYPSDMTSVFTSGAPLLIDCGVDGNKGVDVISSEYIGDPYTKVIIIPDILETYSKSTSGSTMNITFTDNLLSVQISGGSFLTDVEYEDGVTFNYPGNELPEETKLICTFDDSLIPIRYFIVSGSETINTHTNSTMVKLGNGLPITENMTTINIES